MSTDRSKAQWIDLGIHTEACMTVPGTCGTSGGAVSVWYRMIHCSPVASIVTTMQNRTSGGSANYYSAQQVTLVP